jgi:hypothetical protein
MKLKLSSALVVADWGNAFVVALVLSIAVVMAAIAITVYDSAVSFPNNRTNTPSEPWTTGQVSAVTTPAAAPRSKQNLLG